MKQPRKKPIQRAVLIGRIERLEKELADERARVQELEQELTAVKIQNAKLLVANRERQL